MGDRSPLTSCYHPRHSPWPYFYRSAGHPLFSTLVLTVEQIYSDAGQIHMAF